MYFPHTPAGKLVKDFHRRLWRIASHDVVIRLKEAPPDWQPMTPDGRLLMFKVKHRRFIVDMPVDGVVHWWLDQEVAPTPMHPHLSWSTTHTGSLDELNIEAVVDLVAEAFLQPLTLLPITATPYYDGVMTELRYFDIVTMGVSGKGCRITDANGLTINIDFNDIEQGTPTAKSTGYLDTMGRWWFWSRPSRSLALIRKERKGVTT